MASCPKKRKNEDTIQSCCFGKHLQEECHQKIKVEIRSFSDLPDEDKTIYKWRAGIPLTDTVTTMCRYHKLFFSDKLFKKNSKCCDLFNIHKKKKKPDGTHNLTLQLAEQLKSKEIHVIPGWKVCRNCYQRTQDFADEDDHEDDQGDDSVDDPDDGNVTNEFETSAQIEEQRDMLNESFGIIGISPLKTHAVAKTSKIKAAREKLNRSLEKQKEMVKDIFELPDTTQLETKESLVDKEMKSKADNFDRLMFLMKEKLNEKSMTTSQKIQILTMAPLDWSRDRVATFFNVTEYQVREARKLAADKGILALPESKQQLCIV